MTHGDLYKFTILNQSIFQSSWDIEHKYSLKNRILFSIVGLETRLRGLPQDEILDPGDPKLHR